MAHEDVLLTAVDGYPLSVRIYTCDNPKGVVKIIHGMEEHQGRYEGFANFLQENGYIVVSADMRGHGKNAQFLSHIADDNGDVLLLKDENTILNYIEETFPSLPVILFAHSMGSIIARVFLQTESNRFAKAILCGFPNYQIAVKLGIVISNLLKITKGKRKYSNFLTSITIGAFASSVKDAKSGLEWLSYNETNYKNYDLDPLCGEEFTISSYNVLFKLLNKLHAYKRVKNINRKMPILMICGEDDPCVGGEKGIKDSVNTLKKYGFEKITLNKYENMRHEILNEKENKKVHSTIISFLNKK